MGSTRHYMCNNIKVAPPVQVNIINHTGPCSGVLGRDGVLVAGIKLRIDLWTRISHRELRATTEELELHDCVIASTSVDSGTFIATTGCLESDLYASNHCSLHHVTVLGVGIDIKGVGSRAIVNVN